VYTHCTSLPSNRDSSPGAGGRASAIVYCASVSLKVAKSPNVRRNGRFIARGAVHHCAPLQLGIERTTDQWLQRRMDGHVTVRMRVPLLAPSLAARTGQKQRRQTRAVDAAQIVG